MSITKGTQTPTEKLQFHVAERIEEARELFLLFENRGMKQTTL